jgi:internalin A
LHKLTLALGLLTNLLTLSLSHNKLTAEGIPDEISNLTNLRYLFLSANRLASLPESVCLPALNGISLSMNQIQFLPEKFVSLAELSEAYFHHNQLLSLPPQFGRLTKLKGLTLHSNHLTSLPLSLLSVTTTLTRGSFSFHDNRFGETHYHIGTCASSRHYISLF